MTVREKIEKGFELANYLVLTLLITAQCTVGSNFFVGQFIYFSANVLAVVRCFVLKRPMADKVKDFCMLGITTGLILIKFLGGIRSQKGDLKMFYEYNATVICDIFGTEIKIDIPYLDSKPTKSLIREIVLEIINDDLFIKNFNYTTTCFEDCD